MTRWWPSWLRDEFRGPQRWALRPLLAKAEPGDPVGSGLAGEPILLFGSGFMEREGLRAVGRLSTYSNTIRSGRPYCSISNRTIAIRVRAAPRRHNVRHRFLRTSMMMYDVIMTVPFSHAARSSSRRGLRQADALTQAGLGHTALEEIPGGLLGPEVR
jgi:hypothetical protein